MSKIVFLSRYQNKIQRGAETFVRELADYLSKKHQVDILVGEDADSLQKILKGNYQVVISINGRLQSLKASIGRIFSHYKLVIPGQSGIGPDIIWNTLIIQPDIFVALTGYMENWIKKWAPRSKVIKIPNGINLNKFNPSGEKININLPTPIILSVGALVWYKHHEKTIKALSLLSQGSLLIVGEGPEKEKLTKMGNKLLHSRFKIINAEYEDMPKIYPGADLFVLPSWEREAFGIVYLEAMASGLGIVAPKDSPRNEIIGEAGILVDVADSQEYAEAIKKALQLDWKQKAINQAEKFSWDKIAKQYEEAFERIL